MQQYDIVIVGAGMAGASLACALAGNGLRIALLDNRAPQMDPEPLKATEFDARVSAITPASQAILERMSVWPAIRAQRISPYTGMEVWEADGTAGINFTAEEMHVPQLGHIIENRVILQALQQRVAALDDIDLLAPVQLEGFHYVSENERERSLQIRIKDAETISARLLVAADGGRSQLRRLAGFGTREWDYAHQAVVTTVRTEKPHGQVARQRFSDEGVLAFLPLQTTAEAGADHYCSIVWSLRPERAEAVLALTDEAFARELEQAFESRLGRIEHCSPRFSFPLHQVHARDYVKDRVVLIGDAAHSIHPLAGQGANLGLLDAHVLATQIIAARRSGRCWYEGRVLRAYQRRRKGHNLAMMAAMEGFRRLYDDQPLPLRWLRNAGMRTVDRAPMIKQFIMQEAMALEHLD